MCFLKGALLFFLFLAIVRRDAYLWLRAREERRWLLPLLAFIYAVILLRNGAFDWRLWPAGALLAVLLLTGFRAREYGMLTGWRRRGVIGLYALGLLLLPATAGLMHILPVPELPAPDGPFPVGTITLVFEDPDREEVYSAAGGHRRIVTQIWYPAIPDPDAEPVRWIKRLDVMGPAIAGYLNLPPFILNHLKNIRAHAFENALSAKEHGPFPAVVYSHGWTAFRNCATNQMEKLASHGFVCAAPDHAYGAMATVLPDGRVILNRPDILPPHSAPETVRRPAMEQLVDTYAGDVRLVLDRLEELNEGAIPSPLAGVIAMDRIGVFGHSTGGGAVVEVCAADSRVRAGLGLDPWVEPVSRDTFETRIQTPFFSMRSENWFRNRAENSARLARLLTAAEGRVYDTWVAESGHADFTLLPLLSPLASYFGPSGSIPADRIIPLTDTCLLAFFSQYLTGEKQALLGGPSPDWPELKWVAREE
jgi:hypothetical protein